MSLTYDDVDDIINNFEQLGQVENQTAPDGMTQSIQGIRPGLASTIQSSDDCRNGLLCKLVMIDEACYSCVICGKLQSEYIDNGMIHDETNEEQSSNLNIVGIGSHKYTKLLHSTRPYDEIRDRTTSKQFHMLNYTATEKKFPNEVISLAIEMYKKIQNAGIVLRASKRLGTMAACIYYACKKLEITKKPKDISRIIKVKEVYISTGDKIIRELASKGIVEIEPDSNNSGNDFVEEYFQTLNINIYYKNFVKELLDKVSTSHIGDDKSRLSTKCVGIIYMLYNCITSDHNLTEENLKKKNYQMLRDLPPFFINLGNIYENKCCESPTVSLSVTKKKSKVKSEEKTKTLPQMLQEECKISKSTYNKFYVILLKNRKKFKELFIKHNIPYPVKMKVGNTSKLFYKFQKCDFNHTS